MIRQIDLSRKWGLTRSRICQMVRDGMPLDSAEEAEAWRVGKYGTAPAKLPDAPAAPPSGLSTDREDLSGVLARAVSAELTAWQALKAMTDADISPVQRMAALKHYHAAATLRVQTEQALAEVKVNTGQLVPMAAAQEAMARVLDPLRVSLRAMPRAVAARANPSDPELARIAVEEAVDTIMAQLHTAHKR